MANRNYPSQFAEIEAWSKSNQVSTEQGKIRFMKYVILTCIAANQTTREGMILKGGNALRYAYKSLRSTRDLDFTAVASKIPDEEGQIKALLNTAFLMAIRQFNVKAKCQRIKRNPKKPEATKPTYDVKVGYQLPGDRYFHDFANRPTVPTVIPVEITLNDLVCDTKQWADVPTLQVCSLEDILAEKLRSLLQQKIRNRNRWQDVYDICTFVRRGDLDRRRVAEFLKRKSEIRDIEVRKSSFDSDIKERAFFGYDSHVKTEAPEAIIPFEDAWETVKSLVQSLDIPE